MKGLLRCGKRRWRAAGNLNIYPVRSQHAVTQGLQLAAALAQPIKLELGADQALALGLLGDQAAPGVDQQAVAPGAAAIGMHAALGTAAAPRYFAFLEAIPLLPNNKVNRRLILQLTRDEALWQR